MTEPPLSARGPIDLAGRNLRARKPFISYADKVVSRQRVSCAVEGRVASDSLATTSQAQELDASIKPSPAVQPSGEPPKKACRSSGAAAAKTAHASGAVPRSKNKAPVGKDDDFESSMRESHGESVGAFLEAPDNDGGSSYGAVAASVGKGTHVVDQILRRVPRDGIEPEFEIKWVGWKLSGNTVEWQSSIAPDLVSIFEQCEREHTVFPSYDDRMKGKVSLIGSTAPSRTLHSP